MSERTRVLTVVGTRPEIIRLSRVVTRLDQCVDHVLVHTGQNYDYELNAIFFEQMGLRQPDYCLNCVGETLAESVGNIISKVDKVLEQVRPDAMLVLGDTNSCLSVIAAKRRKIPIFHMEAGNRCFDQRVPEETNRKIVDHVSDINMTYTEHGRRYLMMEGLPPERVIKTGSPLKEVLTHYLPEIEKSDVLSRLSLEARGFFLVSAHREENIEEDVNFVDLLDSLNAIAEIYKLPVVVSTHPRTRKRLDLQAPGGKALNPAISFLRPLGFFDYVNLQMNAKCVISDSGSITEESSILGFPAVTIRQAHERPEGMDEGVLVMCGLRSNDVLEAIQVVAPQSGVDSRPLKIVSDYDTVTVSEKVVRIILSYRDYVKRVVWRQPSVGR